ncbi:MAG TPA: hypothetical protein VJL60_06155, partial [Gammaproteobacteria bacterium]|nr:hypothetical protein [Gammaproteobacteria bacterium]
NDEKDFTALVPLIEKTVAPYLIFDGKHTASELLKKQLSSSSLVLTVCDTATGGSLESTLRTPETAAHLNFSSQSNTISDNQLFIHIKGLDSFWQEKNDASHTALEIIFTRNNTENRIKSDIPFRGSRVKLYAVEFICREILTATKRETETN